MKENAKKQLAPINIHQIKETLKRVAPEAFDKMIISENEPIKRCNLIYVNLKYQKAERVIEKIKFPLYDSLKESFAELEGGSSRHGEKCKMPSERIFELLQKNYSKSAMPIINNIDVKEPFVFPFDIENEALSLNQSKYYFPGLTYQETCNQCYGYQYVNCHDQECNGRHKWNCTNCNGSGILICEYCGGEKTTDCPTCAGTTHVQCKRCGGDGKINDGFLARTIFSAFVKEKVCGDCAGKGYLKCADCTNGKVPCKKCNGIGKVICPECGSQGTITCFNCYGDKERYGKTNCPQCQAESITGEIVYVRTKITEHQKDKFILEGPELRIIKNQIKKHINQEQKPDLIYKRVNDKIIENYNEYSRLYASNLEKDLELYKGEYPLLTKEEIYYQVIACVELSYKHVLTNTVHEFTIIDFWNKPEIIYHSEPELLIRDVKNSKKAITGFLGNLFKTKKFKIKRDVKNEIILLINLAKIDGRIVEQEKIKLSQMISNLKDFTNSEKQSLYNVLNTYPLPELKKTDVQFSSAQRGQEVLNKLISLAGSDGETAEAEKAFIEKVKGLM